jgi:magnesium transporter
LSDGRRRQPGARPGTLNLPEDSPAPRTRVMRFGPDGIEEHEDVRTDALRSLIDGDGVTWIDVQGLGEEAPLLAIAAAFQLHPIALENAVNVPQRAKCETYGSHRLIVARVPVGLLDGNRVPEQVSLVVGPGFVLSFQARYLALFDGVRARIRNRNERITRGGAPYLVYALLDAVVDHYYPVVDTITERIDEIEDDIGEDLASGLLSELHELRRALAIIRRVGAPQLETLGALIQDDSAFMNDSVRSFLRDTRDHMSQVLDRVESARETILSLAEIYLSQVSFRTNEIMKVLTLMASIFIPLTFIAGIYGMNFEAMPELSKPWAYPMVISIMVAVAVGMLWYFRRRGWLGAPARKKRDD